jgi:hypothetical protein
MDEASTKLNDTRLKQRVEGRPTPSRGSEFELVGKDVGHGESSQSPIIHQQEQ